MASMAEREEVGNRFFGSYFREMKERYVKDTPLIPIDDYKEMKEGGVYVDLGDPSSGWGPQAFVIRKIITVRTDGGELINGMEVEVELLEDHHDEGLKGDIREWWLPEACGFIYDATSLDNVVPHEPDYDDLERKLVVAIRSALSQRIVPRNVIDNYERHSIHINNGEYPDDEIHSLAESICFQFTNIGLAPDTYREADGQSSDVKYKSLFAPAFREVIASGKLSDVDNEAIRVYLDEEIPKWDEV